MQQLEIVAMSRPEMRVMLSDETILAIRTLHDDTGHETKDWDEAVSMLIVDHRKNPPLLISVQLDAIEFSPEA